MSENKQQAAPKKKPQQTDQTKKKKSAGKIKHSKFLWFALLVAMIPVVLVGWMLIQASMQTGTPINGDRYFNDLDPAIAQEKVSEAEAKIRAAANVEDTKLYLEGSTLRILVDIKNDISVDDAKKLGNELLKSVFDVLPMNTYFTRSGIKKMYDLEIYLSDQYATSSVTPSLVVVAHKKSNMEQATVEVLSSPKNPDYVKQLEEAKKKAEEPEESAKGDE